MCEGNSSQLEKQLKDVFMKSVFVEKVFKNVCTKIFFLLLSIKSSI